MGVIGGGRTLLHGAAAMISLKVLGAQDVVCAQQVIQQYILLNTRTSLQWHPSRRHLYSKHHLHSHLYRMVSLEAFCSSHCCGALTRFIVPPPCPGFHSMAPQSCGKRDSTLSCFGRSVVLTRRRQRSPFFPLWYLI